LTGDSENKKYRLTKWSIVCCPKDQGVLGVHDFKVKNKLMLGKYLACGENIMAQKQFLRLLGNLLILIFGLVLWRLRNTFFHTVLSPLGMYPR
jgi:hypothetical protein